MSPLLAMERSAAIPAQQRAWSHNGGPEGRDAALPLS
jgi:hypothetical protein